VTILMVNNIKMNTKGCLFANCGVMFHAIAMIGKTSTQC